MARAWGEGEREKKEGDANYNAAIHLSKPRRNGKKKEEKEQPEFLPATCGALSSAAGFPLPPGNPAPRLEEIPWSTTALKKKKEKKKKRRGPATYQLL